MTTLTDKEREEIREKWTASEPAKYLSSVETRAFVTEGQQYKGKQDVVDFWIDVLDQALEKQRERMKQEVTRKYPEELFPNSETGFFDGGVQEPTCIRRRDERDKEHLAFITSLLSDSHN